jgi:hypothetical protein
MNELYDYIVLMHHYKHWIECAKKGKLYVKLIKEYPTINEDNSSSHSGRLIDRSFKIYILLA